VSAGDFFKQNLFPDMAGEKRQAKSSDRHELAPVKKNIPSKKQKHGP
jgi:hypothetical protein